MWRNRSREQGRLRPNAFLCVRFSAENIMQACARLQETLVTRDPRLLSALIPLEKLHATLCLVHVSSATEIATVHRVVADNQHLVNEYMTTEDHSIALNGVSTFGNRVLYAQVDSTAIRSVATMLQLRLRENGVNLVGNHEPFQAHVTLCKLSGRNHSIDASIYGDLMADCPLGSQRINTIDFCAVGSKHLDPDGFYQRLAPSVVYRAAAERDNY